MSESEGSRARWIRILARLSIFAAACLPYLGVLDAPFEFDDVKLVGENAYLHASLDEPAKLLDTFRIADRRWDDAELRPNYRPVRFLSYWLDYKLTRAIRGDFDPKHPPVFVFHATNIWIHGLNALLVFGLLAKLLEGVRERAPAVPFAGAIEISPPPMASLATYAAFWGALLYALHPLATEAVTYVSGRRDVLSTLFFLLAVRFHLRERPDGRVPFGSLLLVPAAFALGLLSKEMVITLPAVLLVLDLARRARLHPVRVAVHAIVGLFALGFVALTVTNPGLVAHEGVPGLLARVGDAGRFAVRYLRLALLPWPQSIDYSFEAIPETLGPFEPWSVIPSLVLVAGLSVLGLRSLVRREREPAGKLSALGVLWFFVTLLPVLQLVPAAERFAERFAYLPLVGFVLVVAAGLARLIRSEAIIGHGLPALLALLACATTVGRNRDWESPLALWTSAVEAQPRAGRAHLGRANALKAAGRFREALEEYSLSIDIFSRKPGVPLHHGFLLQARTLRAGVRSLLGREDRSQLDLAASDFREVLAARDTDGTKIESSTKHTALHFDLAGVLLAAGKTGEARLEYARVVELGEPVTLVSAAEYYLGKIALAEGREADSLAHLRRAYEAIPAEDPVRFQVGVELADAFVSAKKLDEADALVTRALEGGAKGSDRLHLLYRRAKVLDRRGDLDGSTEVLQKILEEKEDYAPALLTLASTEMARGHLDEAEAYYQRVHPLDPSRGEAVQGLGNLALRRKLVAGGELPPSIAPESAQVLEALEKKGLSHLAEGQLIAARETFAALLRRASAAREKSMQVKALRALSGIEEGFSRFPESEQCLRWALDLDPLDAEAWLRLGDFLLRRTQDRAGARVAYERYLANLARDKVPEPRVWLNLATLLRGENVPLAIEYAEKARGAGLEDPRIVDRLLGYLHAENGSWQRSLDFFNRYLESAPPGIDAEREAVRIFVRDRVLPHCLEP